jgi:hypothetical protein
MSVDHISQEMREKYGKLYEEELTNIVRTRGVGRTETDIIERSMDAASRATTRILNDLEERISKLEAEAGYQDTLRREERERS